MAEYSGGLSVGRRGEDVLIGYVYGFDFLFSFFDLTREKSEE